jgi:hypothetical protein
MDRDAELGRGLLVAFGTGLLVALLNGGGVAGAILGGTAALVLGALVVRADCQLRRERDEHERCVRELDRKYGKNH